jgi:1-acyl-sn-glycerol-3-phosphate acyltransferase
MIALRSFLFNLAFYVMSVLFTVIGSPLLLGPRSWAMAGLEAHARTCIWLMRWIVGTRLKVRGRDKLPVGAALIAAKHQSTWDTFGLVPVFRDPCFVLKAELLMIPFYGWFCRKFEHIVVKREKPAAALRGLIRDAKAKAAQGRHIILFPEGNRRAPGAAPDYKPGIVALYEALDVPCYPVALNSGLYWPRRKFMRLPGIIVVEILDPIPPGLPRAEFRKRLETAIEAATSRLIAEAGVSVAADSAAVAVSDEQT